MSWLTRPGLPVDDESRPIARNSTLKATRSCTMSPQSIKIAINAIYYARNTALFGLLLALIYNQTFWIFVCVIAAGVCTAALKQVNAMPQAPLPKRSLVMRIIRISVPLLLTMFAVGYVSVWLSKQFP